MLNDINETIVMCMEIGFTLALPKEIFSYLIEPLKKRKILRYDILKALCEIDNISAHVDSADCSQKRMFITNTSHELHIILENLINEDYRHLYLRNKKRKKILWCKTQISIIRNGLQKTYFYNQTLDEDVNQQQYYADNPDKEAFFKHRYEVEFIKTIEKYRPFLNDMEKILRCFL